MDINDKIELLKLGHKHELTVTIANNKYNRGVEISGPWFIEDISVGISEKTECYETWVGLKTYEFEYLDELIEFLDMKIKQIRARNDS